MHAKLCQCKELAGKLDEKEAYVLTLKQNVFDLPGENAALKGTPCRGPCHYQCSGPPGRSTAGKTPA